MPESSPICFNRFIIKRLNEYMARKMIRVFEISVKKIIKFASFYIQ